MLRALIFNITLAGFGLAIPTISPSYNSFTQIDLFDDITGATGVAVAPVGSNSIYKTLKFNGFSLVATLGPSTNNLPNVIAQSDPNYIAFSALDAESVLQGTPAITATYTDSQIPFFDLKSFFYACALGSQESIVGVPVSCNITVTGYSPAPANKQVGKATFVFNTNGGVSVDMQKATLPQGFTGLGKAVFSVQNGGAVTTGLTAGLVDNVENTVYISVKPWG
ncbi:hypothetical protein MMC21_007030 [Puttea exsequens]|nr:hypothetical protein [Puttea exsequens]